MKIGRRQFLASASATALTASFAPPSAWAQAPKEVEVGLLMPLSGLYARFGASAREGAEMGVERVNSEGGVKALGGAKLKLVVARLRRHRRKGQERGAAHGCRISEHGGGQRLVSQHVDAGDQRSHRARAPADADFVLLRPHHRIAASNTSSRHRRPPARRPTSRCRYIINIAKAAGADPKTVAIITDNTAASVASVKPMREHLLKDVGLKLVVDETFTPPLAGRDAAGAKGARSSAGPPLFLPTVISDAKLVLEKMNEFGMGKGKVPTIAFGIAMFEPDMLKTMSPECCTA